MIFGLTTAQRARAAVKEQSRIKAALGGVRVFAYLPVRVECGRWAWLVPVYRRIDCVRLHDGTHFQLYKTTTYSTKSC